MSASYQLRDDLALLRRSEPDVDHEVVAEWTRGEALPSAADRLAVELLARAIHREHAERLPGTAPFERCPHRADEMAEARRKVAAA